MGGEINIRDKEHGERGNCSAIWSTIRAVAFRKPPKVEGIQSLSLIEGDETKRFLQTLMENMEMKAWIVDKWELLYSLLEKRLVR